MLKTLFVFKERREGKNIAWRPLCMWLEWGLNLQPRATQARALTRNRTSHLSLCRMMPNQLSHTN